MPVPAADNVAEGNMPDLSRIAGVVLAGGKSSRMGRNKALLDFKGRPLVSHMMDILRDLGLKDIFISGSVPGYPCIGDDRPFEGPARAISGVLEKKPGYDGYLFVPVDMPFLTPCILRDLISQDTGGYFIGRPLPLFLVRPVATGAGAAVHGFIDANSLSPLVMPSTCEAAMVNLNTPQEWNEALLAS